MKKRILSICITTYCLLLTTTNSFAQANQPGAGNCLSFNGTTNYVLIPQSAPLNFNYNNTFTFETWVSVSDISGERRIINKQRNITNELHITLGMGADYGANPGGAGRFYFKIGGQNSWAIFANSTFVANTNEYYHLAGVYDGATIYLYVNGILQSAVGRGALTTIASPSNINVSRLYANIDYFSGKIDEIRIWNYARTQNQIRDNMCKKLLGNEVGLVGYWRFDETDATNIYRDSQTNVPPNNGTGL